MNDDEEHVRRTRAENRNSNPNSRLYFSISKIEENKMKTGLLFCMNIDYQVRDKSKRKEIKILI